MMFLGLAESDFSQSSDAARAGLSLVGSRGWKPCPTYLACSDAAVIRYARPFMGNRLPGVADKAFLPLSYLPKRLQGVEAFHQSVMELRHQFSAHSDMNKRDLRLEKLAVAEHGAHWRGHARCAYLHPPDLHALCKVAAELVRSLKVELSLLAEVAFPEFPTGETIRIRAQGDVAESP